MKGTQPANQPNQPLNPWSTNQRIFVSYRWLTWVVTVIWLLGQGQIAAYSAALLGTLILTTILTIFAKHYIDLARVTPTIMLLDIILVVVAIANTGGWDSPFFFIGFGSLALPGLLYGWPWGVMAGLAFVAISQSVLSILGMPSSNRFFEGTLAGLAATLAMVVPPVFGALFPVLIDRVRNPHHGQSNSSQRRDLDLDEPFPPREPRLDMPRYQRPTRTERRDPSDAPAGAQLTRTRVEPSVEELRRVIFAPLPAPDMDLGAIYDVLATRFGQQTGVTTRVALIGRTRPLRSTHRDLFVRVAQEALMNIQQHAHASHASLTFRYDINSAALLIQDDGVGLVDGTYERPGLHALRAMQYRVAEFGGRLDVFETEGGGVTVRATMPLE
ncbi:MAG: ATP-binding protein [Roseiflexaceae bacterium]